MNWFSRAVSLGSMLGWLIASNYFLFAETPRIIPLGLESTNDSQPSISYQGNVEAEQRMKNDLEFLASDALRGRGPETGGLDRAAEFIADRFRSLGLETQLFNDSPFQKFTIPGTLKVSKADRNFLRWETNSESTISLILNRDFRPLALGGNAAFQGSMVFVGYGITARDQKLVYDDYANLDVRGKVAIMLRKEPQQSDPNSPFEGTKATRHAYFATKLANAKQHGVTAVIFVNDFLTVEKDVKLAGDGDTLPAIEDAGVGKANETLPAIFLKRAAFQRLLALSSPGVRLEQLEADIDRDLRPQSFELNKVRMIGQVFLEKSPIEVKNVVASLPGKGVLANQSILFGAHYDHVGMGGIGSLAPGTIEVHNGADDNASGTAMLLELARRYSESRSKSPAEAASRRLVFCAFTGEERGLLGSRHYVAHPRFPIESTAVMINFDMVGRMRDRQLIVFGVSTAPTFDSLLERSNREIGLQLKKRPEGLGPSDHQPFYERKVPVLHFFTGLHEDYHRPSDDFDKINTAGMVEITDIVYRVGDELSKSKEKPQYLAVKGSADIRIPVERKARLGIRMRLNEQHAKIEIVSVEPDSAADRAGLQSGDLIVSFNGQRMVDPKQLSEWLADQPPRKSAILSILRGQKPFEIPIEFDH